MQTFCWEISAFLLSFLFFLLCQQRVLSYNASLGEAVRGTGKSIYIVKDGIRHYVTDWNYFLSLGYGPQDIHTYADSILQGYPLGDPISPPKKEVKTASQSTTTSTVAYLPCPCRSSSSHNIFDEEKLVNLSSKVHVICMVKNMAFDTLVSHAKHNASSFSSYKFITAADAKLVNVYSQDNESFPASALGCEVLIILTANATVNDTEKMERRCPGVCKPFPMIEIPVPYLIPPYDFNQSILCSMTMGSALTHVGGNAHQQNAHGSNQIARNLDNILHSIARRRMEECLERGLWPMGSFSRHDENSGGSVHRHVKYTNSSYLLPHKSRFPRRKVYGLIIWIGSRSRYNMLVAQTEALRMQDYPLPDSQKIFGWIATEDSYACRKDFPGCKSPYAYHWMMPSTKMAYDGKSGWGCAQRRPLRALSHTLLLFDPEFLLIVDDDTYVNVKLLNYGSIISNVMFHERQSAIAMGHLTGGNKITRGGFFYGGAGYLLTKGILERLVSFKLSGPQAVADSYRDNKHYNHLGVMEEVVMWSKKYCTDECVKLTADTPPNEPHFIGNKADLKVRLVDICTNIFSEEDTCYHSDHALSRCFAHAAYADIWNVKCQGFKISTNPDLVTSMCMGTDVCWPHVLTCHRWMVNTSSETFAATAANNEIIVP
eukprot:gene24741-33215_t